MAENENRWQKPKRQYTPGAVWRPKFLETFALTMNWSASCRSAGIPRQTAEQAYRASRDFHEQVEKARQDCIDGLELEAVTRARTSDRLLQFMLRTHKPEVYDRPKTIQHTGADGGPISLDIIARLDSQLDRLASRFESASRADSEAAEGRAD